jgi:hypothetical protein
MLGTQASGVGLMYFPYFIYEALVRNTWPTEIRLAEFPLDQVPSLAGPSISSVARIHSGLLEAAFVRYFESQRDAVAAKFGTDSRKWPAEWNFARVVRNACAHGGVLSFDNPKADPVAWRNLRYSPADNGRKIVFVDLSPVEFILLFEDLDRLL